MLLLALAVPRVAQDVFFAPSGPLQALVGKVDHDIVVSRKSRDEDTSHRMALLRDRIDRYEQSLERNDNARDRLFLAKIYFEAGRQAQRVGNLDLMRSLYASAVENFRLGLAEDPGRPLQWAQMTYALALMEDRPALLAQVLGQSIKAAPFASNLTSTRVQIAFDNWIYLNEEVRDLVRRQVRIAAFLYPVDLVKAMRDNRDIFLARLILQGYPPLLGRFEVALDGRDPDGN